MPINFPATPTLNQQHTYLGHRWTWTGSAWQVTSVAQVTGATGSTGPAGVNGATGATGQAANVLVSSSPPVTADPGDLWLDDETCKLRIYYGGGWAGAAVGPIGATGATGAGANAYDMATTSTGYISIPVGNTAQRPASPPNGALRVNVSSTSKVLEIYSIESNTWVTLNTVENFQTNVEYLVVAGGGGGGGANAGARGGGGGGAGGYRTSASFLVSASTNYTVTVGGGGSGGIANTGSNGSNSVFATITSAGGGGGGGWTNAAKTAAANGGSGGGAPDGTPGGSAGGIGNTPIVNPVQGYDGGASISAANGSGGAGGGGSAGVGSAGPAPSGDHVRAVQGLLIMEAPEQPVAREHLIVYQDRPQLMQLGAKVADLIKMAQQEL